MKKYIFFIIKKNHIDIKKKISKKRFPEKEKKTGKNYILSFFMYKK